MSESTATTVEHGKHMRKSIAKSITDQLHETWGVGAPGLEHAVLTLVRQWSSPAILEAYHTQQALRVCPRSLRETDAPGE